MRVESPSEQRATGTFLLLPPGTAPSGLLTPDPLPQPRPARRDLCWGLQEKPGAPLRRGPTASPQVRGPRVSPALRLTPDRCARGGRKRLLRGSEGGSRRSAVPAACTAQSSAPMPGWRVTNRAKGSFSCADSGKELQDYLPLPRETPQTWTAGDHTAGRPLGPRAPPSAPRAPGLVCI